MVGASIFPIGECRSWAGQFVGNNSLSNANIHAALACPGHLAGVAYKAEDAQGTKAPA